MMNIGAKIKNIKQPFPVFLTFSLLCASFLVACNNYDTEDNKKVILKELCVDKRRPIDSCERKTVSEKLTGNTLSSETCIAFSDLPLGVRQVIQLTTKDRYVDQFFHKETLLSPDPALPQESVICYMYTPIVFDEEIGETLSLDSWRFMIQEGGYKLVSFELGEVSQ